MSSPQVTREVLPDHAVRIAAAGCQFRFTRPSPGVLYVEVSGHDGGQFGTAALDEITQALLREKPIELFVDAHATTGVATRVREEWTRFFSSNRANFTSVHILTASKIVHLSVAVAQLFSNTGSLMQLYSSPEAFHARLARTQNRPRPH